MSEHFFSRWSRRKQGLDSGEPPQTDHVLVRQGQVVDYWDGE